MNYEIERGPLSSEGAITAISAKVERYSSINNWGVGLRSVIKIEWFLLIAIL